MQSFEAGVDTGLLWEALEEHVPKKKKRWLPFVFIISFIAVVLTVGIVSTNFSPKDQAYSKIEEQSTQIKKLKVFKEKSNNELQFINNEQQKTENEIGKTEIESPVESKVKTNNINQKQRNNITTFKKASILSVAVGNESKVKDALDSSENQGFGSTIIYQRLKRLALPTGITCGKNIPQIKLQVKLREVKRPLRHLFSTGMTFSSGSGKLAYSAANQEKNEQADYYSAVSSLKPVLGANLFVEYSYFNRVYLKTGLVFTRLVNEYHPNWNSTDAENVTTLSGLAQTFVSENTYEAIGHSYHYTFDIPVTLGLELVKTRKMTFRIEGGFKYNAYTNSQGYYLAMDRKISPFNNKDLEPYNSKFALSWHSGLSLEYKLGERSYLILNTLFESKNIDFRIEQLNLKENYQITRLNLGIKYDI